jgi:catecholate siderophore receptor
VRYVPGVNWHQGENNRDQVVIRGQSSNADFFVNGMRDDAQVYRDLYNAERVEFLKGPNAMIFGRGGGGGVVNRVLKEADGETIREIVVQGGMFDNKRVSTDVGGKVNDQFAARLNAVYENSGSFRDFVDLKRYGVNPTFTWTPTADTKVTFSYEYFNDWRVADRGIPSLNGAPFFASPISTFFGNPDISYSKAVQNIATTTFEHQFTNGFSVKSQTRFADTQRYYQNVYPGSAVNPATDTLTLSAYNNANDRQNLFNQTDWTWKLDTGMVKHTVVAGTEFGKQKSNNARFAGFFDNGTSISNPVDAFAPTVFDGVDFRGQASDARNRTDLNVASVYAQDQMELTRWLQIIGGLRFQRFDLDYINLNNESVNFGEQFSRTDNLTSPRLGVVLKPVDNVSLYASWSRSYLPASGDQFNSLNVNTTQLKPEQFTNKEVGVKWDITPVLAFTAAVFRLDRENTPIADPTTPGAVIGAGHSRVDGEEVSLTGRITDKWQVTAGFAHLDARFLTNTANAGTGAPAALAGARVPLVPMHTYSLWNRYDFTEVWAAGLGIINQTSYFAAVDNTVLIPGFTRVDGAIYWNINKDVRAQMNVENIFGAKYYASADGNNNISPGSPRAVRFVLTSSF